MLAAWKRVVGAVPEVERHGHSWLDFAIAVVLGDNLSKQSDELFTDAQDSHKTSNRYALVTVIAAAALFMLGVAGVARRYSLRIAFFALGTVFFAISVVQIARIGLS